MFHNISDFFESVKNSRIAVIGLGVSHNDMIDMFLRKGLTLTVLDKRIPEKIDEYGALVERGVRFIAGEHYLDNLTEFDIIIRTPGMYFLSPPLVEARKNGVVITSEMELFFDLCPCKFYAITGSDGKTTTTALISEMLSKSGINVFMGGNIGKALLPLIEQISPEDVAVVELSSFQLISMRRSPDVAVITNISPNHLDVHSSMQEYIDSKKNLILHQNAFSHTVLNLDNTPCAELSSLVRGKLSYFSRVKPVQNGAYLGEDGYLYRSTNGVSRKLFHMDDIRIPGIHNVENFLTAVAAVGDAVSDEILHTVATDFNGVEHRIEFVRELDGVRYFNDAIATSPTRTIAGLNAFPQKIIVIAGGYDKKIPYDPLAPVLCSRAKAVILMGATAPIIKAALLGCPDFFESGLTIIEADTLENAVSEARRIAVSGDVVSLSPASASFDLYKNFEHKGRHFKQIVNGL